MRKVRIISLLFTLCFLAVSVFTAYILYKSYKDKKRSKAATPEQASAAVVRSSNNDADAIQFNVGYMTGYFMEVKLKGGWRMVRPNDADNCPNKFFKDTTKKNVAVLLTLVDVKWEGKPVFVSALSDVKLQKQFGHIHGHVKFLTDFTEAQDNALRIPPSYYNYLKECREEKGASLRQFKVSIHWSGNKASGLENTYDCDVRLYTKDIPADSDDPKSPNFNLGNWAGIMSALKSSGCGCGNIGGTIKIVLIVVAVAFGVAIVIWLFRTFIGLLRGK